MIRQSVASGTAASIIGFALAFPAFVDALSKGFSVAWVILGWALCLPLLGLMLGSYTKTGRTYQMLLLVFLYFVLNMPSTLLPIEVDSAKIAGAIYLFIAFASFTAAIIQKKKKHVMIYELKKNAAVGDRNIVGARVTKMRNN
ncbi:hypothetical protein LJC74_02565 [Eubacteriales bacterium OttesenSCG-928-A19]|nr:hypothetical protein [Eubacteriales bacterium OttesenSCG-928-A19]